MVAVSIFLISHIASLFKLLLFIFLRLFVIPNPLVKYVIVFLCIFILHLLYKYPRTRFKKLSQLRNYRLNKIKKYVLKTKIQHIYNIFIIIIFTVLFTIGIFLLRYYNKDRILDVHKQYIILKELYNITSFYDYIINIIIFILIFIIYIWVFTRIFKYVKFHIIKRHLYLVGNVDSNGIYATVIFSRILSNITLDNLYYILISKIHKYFEYYYYKNFNIEKPNDFLLLLEENKNMQKYYDQFFINPLKFFKFHHQNILFFILTKWHYLVLFVSFLYDLYFNNFQLTHVFNILPCTFFFEIYLRFSIFIDGLWLPHDQYIHAILYAKKIEVWDNETLLIDGEFYSYENAKIIYQTYIKKGFVKDIKHL